MVTKFNPPRGRDGGDPPPLKTIFFHNLTNKSFTKFLITGENKDFVKEKNIHKEYSLV